MQQDSGKKNSQKRPKGTGLLDSSDSDTEVDSTKQNKSNQSQSTKNELIDEIDKHLSDDDDNDIPDVEISAPSAEENQHFTVL